MLSWFSSITGSYALALLLYALVFKLLFVFFAIKQQKNQIAMAKLAPKIELIKAKYRGRTDQVTLRKQQEEIMTLQQQEGYSVFSGCLPLLLQLPIIMILYEVIRKPLSFIMNLSDEAIVKVYKFVSDIEESVSVSFDSIQQIDLIDKINNHLARHPGSEAAMGIDVSAIPNFDVFGTSLAAIPSFNPLSWLVIIPFAAAAIQWFTMWVSRKVQGNMNQISTDPNMQQTQMSMRMMDLIIPAMTIWMAFSFSAMMGLYWIFQSILGLLQTLILAKVMPIPKYTEEEIKAMHKAQKAQEKQQKAIIKTQPKYKSLHYIDEDDYDDLPEIKNNQNKNQKPMSGDDRPEIKD